MKGPLVSVLMPAFNYARFIPDSLRSLAAQTYESWECIVVDDGSTDDTASVVTEISKSDSRIRYIHQENRRQPAARNNALRHARGEFIQLLDADDLLESRKFEDQVSYLHSHPQVDIVYGSARFFPTDRPHERFLSVWETNESWMPEISGEGVEIALTLLRENIMQPCSALLRRAVTDDVGPFDESLIRADDWDYWLRCALRGKHFEYFDAPQTLALVRSHPNSLTKRNRNLIESSIARHEKVPRETSGPELLAVNEEMLQWLRRVHRVAKAIDENVPQDDAFILVDEDQIRPELIGYPALPFLEANGIYNGPPEDDETAIHELERLRAKGAAAIFFAWPAFWWLDHYAQLREHLSRCARLVHNDDVIGFDLRTN